MTMVICGLTPALVVNTPVLGPAELKDVAGMLWGTPLATTWMPSPGAPPLPLEDELDELLALPPLPLVDEVVVPLPLEELDEEELAVDAPPLPPGLAPPPPPPHAATARAPATPMKGHVVLNEAMFATS
jgi:hypothetical protein